MKPLRDPLPGLADLIDGLGRSVDDGSIADTAAFIAESRRRWNREMAEHVDAVVPHWSTMASYADGKTLWHVLLAVVALRRLDEYRDATAQQQHLLDWTVLLHDIAKQPTHERRDHRHAFRSATVAAQVLPLIGFQPPAADAAYEAWRTLVSTAHRFDEETGEPVQDTTKLGPIICGIDRLFEPDAARLLKAIAMHLSLTVVTDWPSPAPMTPAQESELVTADVAMLLLPLMLADSGGWAMFDPPTLARYYAETRTVFGAIDARSG